MMTLRKIQIAVGDSAGAIEAAAYTLDFADSPGAYARNGEGTEGRRATAMWLGSAEALRCLGVERGAEVSAEQLALALQGRDVDGARARRPGSVPAVGKDGRPLLDADGEPLREPVVNSYDLTFSVPKSVSVLWASANAEQRVLIERAVLKAANAAVEYLIRTRLVISGKMPAIGFAASAALHVTARPALGATVPSPHLHVHMVMVGVLARLGLLRTPNSAALFKNSAMREAGAFGRSVLAEEIEGIGLQVEANTGRGGRYFKVVGVPDDLCEFHSGRQRDVDDWADERGKARGKKLSNREKARGAVATRAPKAKQPSETVLETWDRENQRFGFRSAEVDQLFAGAYAALDIDAVEALSADPSAGLDLDLAEEGNPEPDPERLRQERREQARVTILKRLWEEGPTVTVGAARAIALELALKRFSREEALGLLSEMQRAGDLITLEGGRVTTRYIRSHERYVETVAVKAAQRAGASLSEAAVEGGIEAAERELGGSKLDPEQRKAVEQLTSGGGWACLTGQPGTGKGPVLHAVVEAHRLDGWKVIACAVDGSNTDRLGAQIRDDGAMTIQQLLYREREEMLHVDNRTLILVDEASKLGLSEWSPLAEVIERNQAKHIPVGDPGQGEGIESPGMFEVMLDHKSIVTARLEKVRRHRDPLNPGEDHPWLKEYFTLLYNGDSAEAIKRLREHGAISLTDTREQAMVALVDKWEQRLREDKVVPEKAIMVVHGPNDDVNTVNALAQRRRLAANELGEAGVRAIDCPYDIHGGDVVMLREAAYRPTGSSPGARAPARVENGTTGIVDCVDKDQDCVWVSFNQADGGTRQVRMDFGELRAQVRKGRRQGVRVASLRLAYAGHPFPLQGANYDYVGSLWGHQVQGREDTAGGDARTKYYYDVVACRDGAGTGYQESGLRRSDDYYYSRLAEQLERSRRRTASISYEIAEDDIDMSVELVDSETPPEYPLVSSDPRGELALEKEREADFELVVSDPLDDYEALLGPERLAPVRERVEALADTMAKLDGGALQEAWDRGRVALDSLDRKAAREICRIERNQLLVAERIEGLKNTVESDVDVDLPDAQQRPIEFEERALRELLDRELELRGNRRHPDDWLTEHQETFARAIVAERLVVQQTLGKSGQAGGAAREPALESGHQQAAEQSPGGAEIRV